MALNVQCPHCKSFCQVDEQYLGGSVKCGKCGKPFVVRAPDPPPRVAAPTVKMSLKPKSEEEIDIVLDGPAAAALAAPPPAAPAPLARAPRLDIGSATSPGRVRKRNEDSFLVQHLTWSNLDQRREVALVVVADGMGGHEAGDKASGMVIRQIGLQLSPLLSRALLGQADSLPHTSLVDHVGRAIKETNRAVHQQGQVDPACRGMGATAAVVLVWDDQVKVGHVGDCRVYHFHAGNLAQVTRDHTLVEKLIDLGQLTRQEAQTHPARNEVTQAIGSHADVTPSSHQFHLAPADWLIMAGDGLHTHVDYAMLREALRQAPPEAGTLAQQLVELANKGGGTDNCTVVAIRCY